MSLSEIMIGLFILAVMGGVTYWVAGLEKPSIGPPEELDERQREAKREAASRITNIGG